MHKTFFNNKTQYWSVLNAKWPFRVLAVRRQLGEAAFDGAGDLVYFNIVFNGGCSSMVEPRIVIPAVVGSSPISHPIKKFKAR